MQVFCQIIDSGNMADAARTLGLAPATVTGTLARVEKKLGVRLLDRTTRRMNLTEAGRLWYQHAKQILEQAAEAENAVRSLAVEPRGLLRVTLPLGVAMIFIYPYLHAFSQAYPLIELDLQVNDRFIDLIENRIDLAIRVGFMKDSELIARPLLRYSRVVCASPLYLSAHGIPEQPSDLARHQCLLYRHDLQPVYWDFQAGTEVQAVQVRGTLQSNESNALLAWARAGQGLTRQPSWLVAKDLERGVLVPVLECFAVKSPHDLPGIYAVTARTHQLPAKVKAFLDFFSSRVAAPSTAQSG
ncbi:LysR family transcriptional regulator [Noviherbaspirillum saxi]|uniref:LysR family transcriptional regulator n=2 Tax=Noviherbaspirillum saxi TaxID=2320863 RepID=A0A3A3G7V5_9BURK|nr:LysR family transcriptional regulator [Noviherbaspirillum saxi]